MTVSTIVDKEAYFQLKEVEKLKENVKLTVDRQKEMSCFWQIFKWELEI